MPQHYGLSETESLIMEMIWNTDKPLRFNEIMEYFTIYKNKHWKKQTLHTHLSRLIKKGVLKNSGTGGWHLYEPALSKEAYIQQWTSDFLQESFDGSLSMFIAALTGNGRHLKSEDIKELRKLLNGNDKKC